MSLPPLISRDEIQRRLGIIFPAGSPRETECRSRGAATVVFGCLYVGALAGTDRWAGPMRWTRMSDERAVRHVADADREAFLRRPKALGQAWYADNSRETLRDNIVKDSLIPVGAMLQVEGLATNSGHAGYALAADFAALFAPDLDAATLASDARAWRERHLSQAALARIALQRRGAAQDGRQLLTLPNGESRRLEHGPSSAILAAVVERFLPRFLARPAVLWISESGAKTTYSDDRLAKRLGIVIDPKRTLPDLIAVDLGNSPDDFMLVFVEVVATDGPMTDGRVEALRSIALEAGYADRQIAFVTAFNDRRAAPFRKLFTSLSWRSFAWFATEPDGIVLLTRGDENGPMLHGLNRLRPEHPAD